VVLKRWLFSCEEGDKKDEGEMIWKIEDPSVDVLCHARPLCVRERERERVDEREWERERESVCVSVFWVIVAIWGKGYSGSEILGEE
jgi:hypothetical protein